MNYLLDTNVLVRLADSSQAQHDVAVAAIALLDQQRHECVLIPQVLYEYWVVATREREVNGLGMTVAEANLAITEWLKEFQLLLDERGVFSIWRNLANVHEVKGKSAHDARIVAAMQHHGLKKLLSFNKADFTRFPDIEVLTPTEIIAASTPP